MLRVVAALVVVMGHISLKRFSGDTHAIMRDHAFASDAVIVFFVLSGFIMAFVVAERNRGAANFAFSRATRIFSVAIPALILTIIIDAVGYMQAPDFYDQHITPSPGTNWERAVRALTFSTHWWELRLPPGSNAPWWSLSYEVSYYVLFGMFVFLRGWMRWVCLTLGAVIVGLNTLLLMPAFLMGVELYRQIGRGGVKVGMGQSPAGRAITMAVAPLVAYAVLHTFGVPAFLETLTSDFARLVGLKLQFSYNFFWAAIVAYLVCLHLKGMWRLLATDHTLGRVARAGKWLAGGSFSLYLVHFPVLHILEVSVAKTGTQWLDDLVMLFVTIGICYAFAAVFERPLARLRRGVRAVMDRLRQPRMTTEQTV